MLEEIIHGISDFRTWNFADRIRFFSWYAAVSGTEPFSSADIGSYFDQLRVKKPSAIGPFLRAMTRGEPPQLIAAGAGFRVEREFLNRYNALFGNTPSRSVVNSKLLDLQSRIVDPVEREYLGETMICFSHRAFRACILMAWNLAYYHLVRWIVSNRFVEFVAQSPKTYPKLGITIATTDDFTYLKEDQVLTIARSARIIPNGIHKLLKEKLDRRNLVAHPSAVVVTDVTAEEYIRDLVDNVILAL